MDILALSLVRRLPRLLTNKTYSSPATIIQNTNIHKLLKIHRCSLKSMEGLNPEAWLRDDLGMDNWYSIPPSGQSSARF